MKTHQRWKESINEKFYFMNTVHDKPGNEIHSANHTIKPVNFYCSARGAKTVQLAGNFNLWHPILMDRREDGWWFIQVWLAQGHHQYRFLVDCQPTLDLHATGSARDDRDEPASLIAVS